MEEYIEHAAQHAHEVNRRYCRVLGDMSQPSWEDAPEWQKQSARNGVKFLINNPNAPLSASHDSWMREKLDDGWTYGDVKDPEKKEHPCMVPYDQLPESQQFKDLLFRLTVSTALASMVA